MGISPQIDEVLPFAESTISRKAAFLERLAEKAVLYHPNC